MKPEIRDLEELTRRMEADLQAKKSTLERFRITCNHNWGKIQFSPIITEAYTIPADPPGWGGVDRRPSDIYVPSKTTKQWKRVCSECGLVQLTTRTKKEYRNGDIPGTGGDVEVPEFEIRRMV